MTFLPAQHGAWLIIDIVNNDLTGGGGHGNNDAGMGLWAAHVLVR